MTQTDYLGKSYQVEIQGSSNAVDCCITELGLRYIHEAIFKHEGVQTIAYFASKSKTSTPKSKLQNGMYYLFASINGAKSFILERMRQIAQKEKEEQNLRLKEATIEKERIQQEEKRKDEKQAQFHGYLENKSELQKGRIIKATSKQWRFSEYGGIIRTEWEMIEEGLNNNTLDVKSYKYDTSRKSRRTLSFSEGRKRTAYQVFFRDNFYDVSKSSYDYAKYLLEKSNSSNH